MMLIIGPGGAIAVKESDEDRACRLAWELRQRQEAAAPDMAALLREVVPDDEHYHAAKFSSKEWRDRVRAVLNKIEKGDE